MPGGSRKSSRVWIGGSILGWRGVVAAILSKLGYDVYRIGLKNVYTRNLPYDLATYSPWFEDWFQETYGRFRDHTLLNEDSSYTIHQFCRHCLHLSGDFAESGVYKGGSAYLMASTLASRSAPPRQVHLFDTFEGMPSTANDDPSGIKEGQFGDTSLTAVKDYLRDFPFVSFHPGHIPATLESVNDRRFAFVHIDVDLYLTTRDCLEFFYDRMVTGAVMVFDDYGYAAFRDSVKRAVDEFFRDKEEMPMSLRTGQCIVIKL